MPRSRLDSVVQIGSVHKQIVRGLKFTRLFPEQHGLRYVIILSQIDFLKDRILAPRGCCTPKFLHALENEQVLPARTPP